MANPKFDDLIRESLAQAKAELHENEERRTALEEEKKSLEVRAKALSSAISSLDNLLNKDE